MAERVGFEPTYGLTHNFDFESSALRPDFATSPQVFLHLLTPMWNGYINRLAAACKKFVYFELYRDCRLSLFLLFAPFKKKTSQERAAFIFHYAVYEPH